MEAGRFKGNMLEIVEQTDQHKVPEGAENTSSKPGGENGFFLSPTHS